MPTDPNSLIEKLKARAVTRPQTETTPQWAKVLANIAAGFGGQSMPFQPGQADDDSLQKSINLQKSLQALQSGSPEARLQYEKDKLQQKTDYDKSLQSPEDRELADRMQLATLDALRNSQGDLPNQTPQQPLSEPVDAGLPTNQSKIPAFLDPREEDLLQRQSDIPVRDADVNALVGRSSAALEANRQQLSTSEPDLTPQAEQLAQAQDVAEQTRSEAPKKYGFKPAIGSIRDGKATLDFDTTQEQFGRATVLRKEFQALPVVKNFGVLRQQTKNIIVGLESALNDPELGSKAIPDQILVVSFNKILDPTSVVRESEFARTPEGLSIINRMQGFADKVSKGGVGITDDERKDIARLSAKMYAEAGEEFNNELDRFGGLSGQSRVNPELVTGGIDRFDADAFIANVDDIISASTSAQPGQEAGDDLNTQSLEQLRETLRRESSGGE